jgi:hypothetical protein
VRPHRLVSLISREAVDDLDLGPGVLAVAVIKSANVVVEVPVAGCCPSSRLRGRRPVHGLRHGPIGMGEVAGSETLTLVVAFAAAVVVAVLTAPMDVSGAVFPLPRQLDVLRVPGPALTPTNPLFNLVRRPERRPDTA